MSFISITGNLKLLPRRSLLYFTSGICSSLRKGMRTYKIETPLFRSILTPEVIKLKNIFDNYGYEIRVAGGAVRDLLMGMKPADLDFATTATPMQMKEIFAKEGIRMINAAGEKHGTITPRIDDKENFEVTTLRIDIRTDGRHAEVEYTTNWELDAARRDLTINSMFLGLDGVVYDYFTGIDDVEKRRVAFVGNPTDRMQEDYLRILRYFRFYGRIADSPSNHDPSTIEAIQQNAEGLRKISGERIWVELKKILSGSYAGDIMELMVRLQVHQYLGLPEDSNSTMLLKIWQRCQQLNMKLNPISLMVSLMSSEKHMLDFHGRMKLSAFERDLGLFLISYRDNTSDGDDALRPYKYILADYRKGNKDCHAFIAETLRYCGEVNLLEQWSQWRLPRFPVGGHDLMKAGVPGGKSMNKVMTELKEKWKLSDFSLSDRELLQYLPDVMDQYNLEYVKT